MITSKEITEGTAEIIELVLAKQHLRVDEDFTDEDDLIDVAIISSRTEAENYINKKLLKGSMVIKMSAFTAFAEELVSINDAVTKVEYYDSDNQLQELSGENYKSTRTYLYHNVSFTGELPEVADREDAVIVTVSFGFDFEACPKPIVSAMLLMVGDGYDKRENRTAVYSSAAYNLLSPYRKWQ